MDTVFHCKYILIVFRYRIYAYPFLKNKLKSFFIFFILQLHKKIRFDTGVPQYFDDDDIDHISVLQVISTSNMYFLNEVMKKSKYARIKDSCTNNYNFCSYYAKSNECEDDPDFMNFECSLACHACDQLDIDIRCPLDHERLNKTNIWKEGDLEKMYRRFIEDPYFKQYEPKIISQPNNHTSNNCSLWVITFDNFITEEECDRMIELAAEEGYERSETVSLTLDGVDGDYEGVQNAARTSSNSWCDDACHADSLVQGVIDRIGEMVKFHFLHFFSHNHIF